MHTEHLQNVGVGRVLVGWLIAVAVASIVVFLFVAMGVMTGDDSARDATWAMVAVAVGFLVGGWFTGLRAVEAPILHGIALGLTSLVAWVALNGLVLVLGLGEWTGLTPAATLVMLLTQVVAAVVGCWAGVRSAEDRAEEVASSPDVGVRDRGET
ncbi:MAG TPA: hypothetical protein VK966_01500 [Longimicrobiales bacterium]|nr:hypothetical protein [Longimicrobiales bacterium]